MNCKKNEGLEHMLYHVRNAIFNPSNIEWYPVMTIAGW